MAIGIANGTLYYGPSTTTYPSAGACSGVVTVLWQEGTWYYVEDANSSLIRRGYISSLTNISGTVTTFNPTLVTRYTVLATENGEITYQGPGTTYNEAGSLDALKSVKFLSGNNALAKVGDYAIIEYDIAGSQKQRAWFPHMKLQASAPTPLSLSALQTKFPHGKYWNHVGMDSNYQNGYTNSACPSHNSTATCNAFAPPGSYPVSRQCMGFAEKCGFDSTLFNPRADANGWSTSYSSSSLSTLKAGDIVRYNSTSTEHSIFVTAVNGDTVTFGDCNGTGLKCQIRWGATKSKTDLENNFVHKRSAPQTIL